ncbi:MAG: 2OG-Fe(II) oxygenase [Dokdonella sp.]
MQIDAIRHAANQGDPESLCGLVLIAMGEAHGSLESAGSIGLLMQAARSGFAPALRCLGLAAAASNDLDAARRWFALAWSRGDPVAVALLASICNNDDEQLALHALAATVGVATSVGRVPADTVPAVVVVPGQLPAAPHPASFEVQRLPGTAHRQQPRLISFDNVLTPLECEYVMALAAPALQPSLINDPVTGQPLRHPNRTSWSMTFPAHDGDLWLRQLQKRLARLAGLPFRHAECLAVLRYGIGEEYRPHRDYLRIEEREKVTNGRPGQRMTTAFCYLNDVESGGETDFPILKSRIAPKQGRVVLFDNVNSDGSPDQSTLHAGLPVERGEKWLATMWFREGRFREF